MQVQTFSKTRANFKAAIEAVTDRHEPLLITSKTAEVVMLSREDYSSMVETMYLLRSAKNSQRLIDSIAQLNGGSLIEEELIRYDIEEEKET
ncbi:type II toxin-antitoxin system Phd/YefM family antitoxin [Pseudoalteromonas sp. AOP31-A2-14]|uniref:type II toxin-antitoxin system Phd/YefM family antitoxin n=1 Tax=Pseudoalteromonas sp. AOP31-A2-14 TaxID=3457695 RepID=UPI0040374792